jgi:hypothetical protein
MVAIIEEGVFFFSSDQLWRRETVGLGLNIKHRSMQLHTNSIRRDVQHQAYRGFHGAILVSRRCIHFYSIR